MDNVCHTLVGAAIARAGLNKRSRLGSATLMIAANIPDLDVLVFATNTLPVEFRRGWTHGVVAQVLLPIAVTAVMVLIGRGRSGGTATVPLRAGWLLVMAYLGVGSHVLLDLLNTYGVRLLTPFDWRWFYGDAVFIIDPWLWISLGVGLWWSRRRSGATAARVALGVAAVYIGVMVVSSRVARDRVLDAWHAERGLAPLAVMVGPVPVTPFERQVIIDAGDHYATGTFSWWSRQVRFDPDLVAKNDQLGAARAARASPVVQAFLVWSRFPVYRLESVPGGVHVRVGDMRFGGGGPVRNALGRGRFTVDTIVSDRQGADH